MTQVEWTDRGMSRRGQELQTRIGYVALADFLAVAALLNHVPWPFLLPALAPLFLVGWTVHRHSEAFRWTLRLEADRLEFVRIDKRQRETFTFFRQEAAWLTRSVDGRQWPARLTLADDEGRTRIELRDREVSVASLDRGDGMAEDRLVRIDLAVLIGNWWPNGRRAEIRSRGWWRRRRVERGPWTRPDLDGFEEWELRRRLRFGTLVLAQWVACELVFAIVLATLLASAPLQTADLLIAAVLLAFPSLLLVMGLWWAVPAHRHLRREYGLGWRREVGVILNRHG